METIRKNKDTMLYIIKDIAVKNNITNHEISENTGVSEGTLSRIMRGIVTNPRKNVIDAIYNYLTTHYSHNEDIYNTQENFTMERQEKLKKVKDLIKKYNLTAYEISKNTHLTAVGVQKIINGQSEKPLNITLDTIINYIESNYSHNGATYNTQKNNGGDNVYINNNGGNISNSGNTTGQDKESAGQCNEIKEMTKLLNQLHETKIIEIERLTKLYNEIISNQNELISQYRKEIEYLRQRIKGNTENNKE
jgi:DNA-binding helix-turn-helix protein